MDFKYSSSLVNNLYIRHFLLYTTLFLLAFTAKCRRKRVPNDYKDKCKKAGILHIMITIYFYQLYLP